MGCCISRDLPQKSAKDHETSPQPALNSNPDVSNPYPEDSLQAHSEILENHPPNYNFSAEALSLALQPLSSHKDPYAESLLHYCEDLKSWLPVKETDWMIIEKVDFSTFNKDYPLTHSKVFFGKIIPIKLILSQLNSPDRALWDIANKHWELLSGNHLQEFYTYRKMDLGLLKADFTDKRIVGFDEETVVVIGYGVQGLKEEVKGFTRAFTTLNVHKIYLENGATVLENYQQIDAKSAMAKAFAGLGPPRLIEWGRALTKRINELMIKS